MADGSIDGRLISFSVHTAIGSRWCYVEHVARVRACGFDTSLGFVFLLQTDDGNFLQKQAISCAAINDARAEQIRRNDRRRAVKRRTR